MDPRTPSYARRAGALLATCALLLVAGVWSPTPAQADAVVKPKNGSFKINGRGYGHGIGMSQYGAYGAAQKGLNWHQILAFYYPGTKRVKQPTNHKVRIWITGDHDQELRVTPSTGLKVTDSTGKSYTMPTNLGAIRWRVTRTSKGWTLAWRKGSKWTNRSAVGLNRSKPWTLSNKHGLLKLMLPNGGHQELRGTLGLIRSGTKDITVNELPMTQYLKSVVPAEMPVSWHPQAVRSQAVAARSYAFRLQAAAPAAQKYDLCDTTSCQVYPGYALTPDGGKGKRTLFEHIDGNRAVSATRDIALKYGSAFALTQFSSSNAGYSVAGSQPYLKARKDPYDGVPKSQWWTKSVSTKTVQAKWPSVGTVTGIQVSKRGGLGWYGGRATTVKVIGTKGTVSVAGPDFRFALGLRSTFFYLSTA